ncbi:hypothetical protein FS935_00890 [Metabacillus litoralis]|uniref:YheC/YheD family protein n=1 Tax=Metabacillus litoralis TaxID=152268 RepID=A0A5C6W8N2_9BACI|nr:YheC/YheD family protein [Metabacillus litoralis]TXC92788.1 hypothetical protein FS935_00890 [Metabacillus litoralis]
MKIKWMKDSNINEIWMNPKTISKYNFVEKQQIPITYGTLKVLKELKGNNTLQYNEVGVSPQFSQSIKLPDDVELHVQIKNGGVQFGPLIGMLLKKKFEKLSQKKLELLKERIPNSDFDHGVVFVGALDSINETNKLIKAYYYTKDHEWKEGIFPLPTVLYNRVYIKKNQLKLLKKGVKMQVINNCLMSKSKLWRLLCKDSSINQHLPFTQSLRDVNSFIVMVNHYETVYLKPTNLSRGRGILQAKKMKLGFLIKDTNTREQILFTENELSHFIETLTNKHPYIIQQGVPFTYENSLVDFRVYMQKDEAKEWNCSGIYGRVSKPNEVITNLKHSQKIVPVEDTLRKYFTLDQDRCNNVQTQMIQVCKNVCVSLEKRRQSLADVAIDIVLDEHLKVWVLEVQVNYADDERLYHLPESIYKKVWQTPLYYAKALTDF